MAKKGIDDMIEDVEYFVENCKVQAFSSNKIVVPRDEMLNMLREIKMKIPSEIEHCTHVMENKDAIIAEARKRADDILSAARDEAQRKVNESEIMQMATAQAKDLIVQAQMKAEEIVEQANEEGDAIRIGALNYTNNIMMDLSQFTTRFLEEEGAKYQVFVDGLKDTFQTIETNRAEITAELNSGQVPQDTRLQQEVEGSKPVEKTISEVEQMHAQEKTSSRPGFKVPEVGQEPKKTPEDTKEYAAEAAPAEPVKNKPAKQRSGRHAAPTEEELDELDELYLDEFQ